MRIAIFGSGYVGLVSGACFADVGHLVTCIDIDAAKVARLQSGDVIIYEPGLSEVVQRNTKQGRLSFTTNAEGATDSADLIFIAVGTPADEDGSADLSHVLSVARAIGAAMKTPTIIVNKSTVPVGTADKVRQVVAEELARRGLTLEFHVCSNPEFLKEGAAIADFSRAARIVVGTDSPLVRERLLQCYAPYNRNHDKMMFMDVRSAELTKYAANAMLATRISFMNEVAGIAERLGADIEQVRRGIGSDPRIGFDFLYAGAGYGGSCFPKDVRALAHTARTAGARTLVLDAVEQVNTFQKNWLFAQLVSGLEGGLEKNTIAVWGLSFKPNTDDMREAPSRVLLETLWSYGAKVRAFDPKAMTEAQRIWGDRPDLELTETAELALVGADALVICTEWSEFRGKDPAAIRARLHGDLVVDGRNIYDPASMKECGLRYRAVGRTW